MAHRDHRFGEAWRVLAYTLALALAFVALGRAQLALFDAPATARWLQRLGWLGAAPEAGWQREAAEVAAASQAALQRLPPNHRMAAFRIGYELGYASQQAGAYAMSPPEARARAQALADGHAAIARELAAAFALGEVQPLPVENLRDFAEVAARYEADASGLAARVEQRLSPLHRHLYLLGTQVGGEAARVEGSGGQYALPPAKAIGRHATLAGLDPALWQPLAAEPQGEAPAQVLQRYRAAVQALAAELQRQDAAR